MMKYNITLTFEKDKEKDTVKYLGLVRQVLLATDLSITPKEISFEENQDVLSDPSYFARRMSLLVHKLKEESKDKNIEDIEEVVVLTNETNERRFVYAKELNSQYKDLEAIEPDFLLLFLDPKQKLSMRIKFEEGSALEDSKFCTLGRLGFEFENEPYEMTCESMLPFKDLMNNTIKLVDEQIKEKEEKLNKL